MNEQRLKSSLALKSNVLDHHMSKVNSRYGFNFTFGQQYNYFTPSAPSNKKKEDDMALKEKNLLDDEIEDFDQNLIDASTKYGSTVKDNYSRHLIYEKDG